MPMTAIEAFISLAETTLEPLKARRLIELARFKKGEHKLLNALAHQFEPALLSGKVVAEVPANKWEEACFIFHYQRGFGVEFQSLKDAYECLSTDDSWLIVLADGSLGIHRPESRWDAEQVFAR